MPLTCPHCGNNKSFTAIGQQGKMQCAACGRNIDIDGNFSEPNKDCLICIDADISYYDIMKTFSSNMDKIIENICDDHKLSLIQKGTEFLNKI